MVEKLPIISVVTFFMNSIDKKTWHVYNIKYAKKTWHGGVFMKKDEILNASRKEHRNKDLAVSLKKHLIYTTFLKN